MKNEANAISLNKIRILFVLLCLMCLLAVNLLNHRKALTNPGSTQYKLTNQLLNTLK